MNEYQSIGRIPEVNYKKVLNQLIFAYLGMTKSGKTTGIAAMTAYPEKIIAISSGDNNRTKVTVQYHLVVDGSDDIIVEEFEFYLQSIIMSPDGINKEKFNEELERNKILKSVLKLEKVGVDENLRESVNRQLNEFKKSLRQEDIKLLINTEGIDKYVKKVTLRVKANEEVARFIVEKSLDLYIRDTRGLLDIALEEDANGTKKLSNVRSLSDLGLDGINGVVFFCAENYPNIVSSIYEDTFKNVFQSVPFFLITRDHSMVKLFRSNGQPESLSNISVMINNIQSGKNPSYQDVEDEYFIETLMLLEKFKVVEKNSQGNYEFKDQYFKQSETEFITAECTSLKKLARGATSLEALSSDKDFKFYQYTMIVALKQMVSMVLDLHASINEVITSGVAISPLKQGLQVCITELTLDLQKYDNYHTSSQATEIVKPQLTTLEKADLQGNLVNVNVQVLGKYGGITTLQNGKLRYAATAVAAVTSRQSLYRLIEKITLSSDLTDANGRVLIHILKGDYKRQEALLKKALRYILYNYFTDTEATIQNYLIAKRHEVEKAIKTIRTNQIAPSDAVEECVKDVINSFFNDLTSITSVSDMFINK